MPLWLTETGVRAVLPVGDLIDPMEAELAAFSAGRSHLAPPDCATLAIPGSGVQAGSHLAARREVRHFREVRAWSPHPGHLAAFVEQSGEPVRAARPSRKRATSCSPSRKAFARRTTFTPNSGEVASGARPGRQGGERTTLFKSLGLAVEDIAAAVLASRRARASGRGLRVAL